MKNSKSAALIVWGIVGIVVGVFVFLIASSGFDASQYEDRRSAGMAAWFGMIAGATGLVLLLVGVFGRLSRGDEPADTGQKDRANDDA